MGDIFDHNVKKVECKRTTEKISNYRLSYHIDIPKKAVEKKVLRMDYVFRLTYGEGVGDITVEGSLSYKDTLKAVKEAEEKWGEKLEIQHKVYNAIFRNAVVMVMDMARHVGLPPPINIPKLQPEKFSSGQ